MIVMNHLNPEIFSKEFGYSVGSVVSAPERRVVGSSLAASFVCGCLFLNSHNSVTSPRYDPGRG